MSALLKWIFSGRLTACSTCGAKIIRGDRILKVLYVEENHKDMREDILCGHCGDFKWREYLEKGGGNDRMGFVSKRGEPLFSYPSWITGDTCPGCGHDKMRFTPDDEQSESQSIHGLLSCEMCSWFDDMALCRIDQIPAQYRGVFMIDELNRGKA